MRVLYFPDWVFTALKAQGYQRSESLDENVLTSTLSIDDVVFLSCIQSEIRRVVPESIINTFPHQWDSPETAFWPRIAYDDDHKDARLNFQLNGLPEDFTTPLSNLGCEMMDEETLVFYPLIPLSQYEIKSPRLGGESQDKLDLLDRVIQEIYPYLTFQDLSLTPLMRDYLLTSQACRTGVRRPTLKAAA